MDLISQSKIELLFHTNATEYYMKYLPFLTKESKLVEFKVFIHRLATLPSAGQQNFKVKSKILLNLNSVVLACVLPVFLN